MLRARDYHRKQEQIKILQEKARNRNPDEFYHKMINSSMESGRHIQRPSKKLTKTVDHKLMMTQDINYVQMKLNI
ncbi:probable U3 small nucleolar RNA-associated protein 11 [Dysidea avara]|uniref:probable U3 small nucleolar RNA-associated protein 11 n=1 Tax=Dysidea avara TaxID=196820 RepID=UPI003332D794